MNTRIFDVKITTPAEGGSRREVPLVVISSFDDLKNLLYSLLVASTTLDYINIIITPLELSEEERD